MAPLDETRRKRNQCTPGGGAPHGRPNPYNERPVPPQEPAGGLPMPKRPPPPVELPPEIAVVDLGDGDVRFVFPRRQLGLARHVGWLFLAAAGLFLYWVVK